MFCNFISIDDNTYQCTKCNIIVNAFDGMVPTLPCSLVDINPNEPSMIAKIKNFSQSLIDHAKNNFALADDSDIERRYNICLGCEFFKQGSCTQCGCPINRQKNYISKLSWSSSHCPINKW